MASKVLDISWTKPSGFIDLKTSTIWSPKMNCGPGAGFMYKSMLQSKDGDCLILYPEVALLASDKMRFDKNLARNMMIGEINSALGVKDSIGRIPLVPAFNLSSYVTVLTGVEADKNLHADTVFIAQLPLVKPYREKFLYCIGVYVQKEGRPPMFFKCFFTEAGKNKQDIYLRKLFKGVKYRNDNWQYDDEKYLRENYKFYLKTR